MNNQTPHSGIAFPGKAIGIASVGIVLIAALAPCLTAYEVISVYTEFVFYNFCGIVLFCLFVVCFGVVIDEFLRPKEKRYSKVFSLALTMCSLPAIIMVSLRSDDMFVFWKLKAVSQPEWHQMVSDLLLLDKEGREKNINIHISHDTAPKSLYSLGLAEDCMGGHAGVGSDPSILFGVKSRRWGLEIGTNDFSTGHRADLKRVRVDVNAWFFAGPD